jgi:hypothetical protein
LRQAQEADKSERTSGMAPIGELVRYSSRQVMKSSDKPSQAMAKKKPVNMTGQHQI